jgi:hypothetical protein
LPKNIEDLEAALHRTDDGTSEYAVYELTKYVRLHDTRGQRAFSDEEMAQMDLIMGGRARPGEVVQQRKRYWLLMREFWKSEERMKSTFGRSVMQRSSLATEPHFAFLVVDPNQQELLLEDLDFRACYKEMLSSMRARGLPFAILCTHGDQLTQAKRQALHSLPTALGLGVQATAPAPQATGGYMQSIPSFHTGPRPTSFRTASVDQEHVGSSGEPPAPLPEVLRIVTNYTSPADSPGSDDAQQDIHSLLVLLDAIRQGEEFCQSRVSGERPTPPGAADQQCVLL